MAGEYGVRPVKSKHATLIPHALSGCGFVWKMVGGARARKQARAVLRTEGVKLSKKEAAHRMAVGSKEAV